MKKAAVLFPGIGYSADRPLLYYSAKMAERQGYRIIRVSYSGFPEKKPGDHDWMMKAFRIAQKGAENCLASAELETFDDLIFFSKSIGTAVGAFWEDRHRPHGRIRHILYTPVEETYSFLKGTGIAFHGTSDPWAGNEAVEDLSRGSGIPLYTYDGANHSLETGDVFTDIGNLKQVMEIVWDYLFSGV